MHTDHGLDVLAHMVDRQTDDDSSIALDFAAAAELLAYLRQRERPISLEQLSVRVGLRASELRAVLKPLEKAGHIGVTPGLRHVLIRVDDADAESDGNEVEI